MSEAQTETTKHGVRKQRVIVEQYFDDENDLKRFQQDELLQVVASIGQVLSNYGDKHDKVRAERAGKAGG